MGRVAIIEEGGEILRLHFALFNCHINNAEEKANSAFVRRWDFETWQKEIEPYLEKGIMSIFEGEPNEYTTWYVEAIGIFVNQRVKVKWRVDNEKGKKTA